MSKVGGEQSVPVPEDWSMFGLPVNVIQQLRAVLSPARHGSCSPEPAQ
jgi:hypothetical protein